MRTREQIQQDLSAKRKAREILDCEIDALQKEDILLSDDKRRYVERLERIEFKTGRNTLSITLLIGRVCWMQDYPVGDTGTTVAIERSRQVRVNGEWKSIQEYINALPQCASTPKK